MTIANTLTTVRKGGRGPLPLPTLTKDMTSLDYVRMVHPGGSHGLVRFTAKLAVGKPDAQDKPAVIWCENRHSPTRIREGNAWVLKDLERLRFISFATFPYRVEGGTEAPMPEDEATSQGKKKRKKLPAASQANITSICANWVDLDYYKLRLPLGSGTDELIAMILRVCKDRKWPAPSYILSSGRGMLIVWLYAIQPKEILRRWRVVQRTVNRAFDHLGSDDTGVSATKVYRFVGSPNAKAKGAKAYIAWPARTADIHRGSFEGLSDFVLAQTRAEARAAVEKKLARITAKAAKKVAVKKDASDAVSDPAPAEASSGRRARVGGIVTGRSFWETMRADLDRLLTYRHGTGPMTEDSGRSTFALVSTAVQAFLAPSSALDAFVRDNAVRWGITEHDAMACTSGIRLGARMAADEVKRSFNGRMVDARYRYSAKRVCSLLHITPGEMANAKLRMLVDEEHAKAVAASRQEKVRRAKGAKSQFAQRDRRREIGLEALRLRREEGLTRSQIATRLGEKERYLDTCVAAAKVVESIGVITPIPVPVPATEPVASHVPSRGTTRATVDDVEITPPSQDVSLVAEEAGEYTQTCHGRCTSSTTIDARCVPTGSAGVAVSEDDEVEDYVRSPLGWREWNGSAWVAMTPLSVWLRGLEPGTYEEVIARLARIPA